MTLAPGTRLGPYEIVGPLGAGGMGEVYRAKDTRLGREVAVKVLPQHLTDSPEVRARFEREARTVSSLNHPHICTLHDVGQEGGVDYLVMELVEGETLASRLERSALPMPDVLRIGIQIADALDRAHRAGVVHRDLKPANIMLTRSGAKLMDFGLARATGLAGGPVGGSGTLATMTHSPTMAQPLTAQGSILGTFQYMSPEQMEGGEADARSDLWALGCVLYEMATGRRLVKACLAKDPEDRIQTAHDAHLVNYASALSISPDGRNLIFSTDSNEGARVWLRPLGSEATRPLGAGEIFQGAFLGGAMFWSPDGRYFGYTTLAGKLRKVAVQGGEPVTICNVKWARGADWGSQDRIVFSPAPESPLYAVPGYLLFAREGKILAQPFDSGRLGLAGEAVVIGDAPPPTDLDAEPVVSASDNGRLVFLRRGPRNTRLQWLDRKGFAQGTVPMPPGAWNMFALSPDRRMAAVMNGTELWLVDLARSIPTRFANTFSKEANMVWFGDSRRFFFSSNQSGRAEIYIGSTAGTGEPELVPTTDAQFKNLWDVSPDGKTLVFGILGDNTSWDLWILPLEEGGKPKPYVTGPGPELHARISPDGKWLAYESPESGQPQVYVQSFPVPGRKVRISVDGGDGPGWTRGGKELLYSKEAP
jgi:Tol biopolymer transport system component